MNEKIQQEFIDMANYEVKSFVPDGTLLLHSSLPPPLHGVNPRTIMGKKWWDITRRKAYAEHNFCCWACGVHADDSFGITGRLDAHETYEIDMVGCSLKITGFVGLCTVCHGYIHRNRMNVLFDKGIISEGECWDIISHGDRVLRSQGLNPDDKEVIKWDVKDWNKWHLIINHEKYYSKFKNVDEWKEHYAR